jgi:hypothetical protein
MVGSATTRTEPLVFQNGGERLANSVVQHCVSAFWIWFCPDPRTLEMLPSLLDQEQRMISIARYSLERPVSQHGFH